MKHLRSLILAAAALALVSGPTSAGPEQNIRKALEKAVPGIEIGSIQPAPIDGLYEVMVGSELMYVTGDGRYFVNGHIVDLKTREDLTEPRLSAMRKKLIDTISEDQMVIFAPSQPKHTITVFTDIDCGYCRKLHSQIDKYEAEGIRVRYLFFPRAGKDSPAYAEAVSVWCAGDAEARRTALTNAKSGKKVESKTCPNPVDAHMELGNQIGVRGTPAIVTEKGDLIPGYVDPKRLAAELNGAAGG